jgi:hypothetical protein
VICGRKLEWAFIDSESILNPARELLEDDSRVKAATDHGRHPFLENGGSTGEILHPQRPLNTSDKHKCSTK